VQVCPDCGGAGRILCPDCGGKRAAPCRKCQGLGSRRTSY
jgi:DnaJ-class molecular chaperone